MSSPVKIAKPRGVQGQKKRERNQPTVVLEEFGDAEQYIEKELMNKKLGSFKVYKKDMTFEWKDGSNRKLADPVRTASLREAMSQGIFRLDMVHRMAGCIDKKQIGTLVHPISAKPVKLDDVEVLNKEALFPILRLKGPIQVEMQSGQHRMAMLIELRAREEDHWWIVTLYDDGILFYLSDKLIISP